MSDQLTALDATFLELEEASEGANMHIGGVMVFEPLAGQAAPIREEVAAHVGSRLDLLPRYRQRLSDPRVGRFAWPRWVEDPCFQVDDHVAHAALPTPGGEPELLDWLSDFFSHRLDRTRPLWELVLLDQLGGGRWALCWKTHHCLVDGVGSVDIAHLLLDLEPGGSGAAAPAAADDPEKPPSVLRAWLPHAPAAVRQAAGAGVGAVRGGLHSVAHPREALERSAALVDMVVRDEVLGAPHTSLNQPIGAARRLNMAGVALDDLRAIKRARGGTINDVVLAAVTGGLRRVLSERGEALPSAGLRAMVPVDVRAAEEASDLGNRILSLFVALPVAEPDRLRRYERILAETRARKESPQLLGARTLLDIAAAAPPVVHSFLARSLFASRLFNLTVTNVPGPQQPLYALGGRLERVVPLVPLAADHDVGVAAFSYCGEVVFGLVGDRATMPDLGVLAQGILREVEALMPAHASAPSGLTAARRP